MTSDPTDARLLMTPADSDRYQRMARLRALGLTGQQPDPEFDKFAARLAEATGAPYAMVNFLGDRMQYFAGLYTPTNTQTPAALHDAQTSLRTPLGREMRLDHGFCPEVVSRRKALVLEDVCDYPRFAGNPIVDRLGIRSYMGAPLIDETGTTLGTVCVIDTEPHPWGRPGLSTIKDQAQKLMQLVHQRTPQVQAMR